MPERTTKTKGVARSKKKRTACLQEIMGTLDSLECREGNNKKDLNQT